MRNSVLTTPSLLALSLLSFVGCSSSVVTQSRSDGGSVANAGAVSNAGSTSIGAAGASFGGTAMSEGGAAGAAGSTAVLALGGTGGGALGGAGSLSGGAGGALGGTASLAGGAGGALGGNATTGGVATSGAPATGGTSNGGAVTNPSGGAGVGGSGVGGAIGGSTGTTGGTHAGGAGGAAGSAGAAGTAGCSKDADCANPDPFSCAAPSCSQGVCRSTLLSTVATALCTGYCAQSSTTGFFAPDDAAYVLYAPLYPTGTIQIQKLKADSTDNGGPIPFALASSLGAPSRLTAAMSGNALAILFGAEQDSGSYDTLQLAFTTLSGAAATSIPLAVATTAAPLRSPAQRLFIAPNSNGWTIAALMGVPIASWTTFSGTVTSTTTTAELNPALYDDHASVGILDDVVMITGHSEYGYRMGSAVTHLKLGRFTVADLSSLDVATGQLDLGPLDNSIGSIDAYPTAMAKLGSGMAVIWNFDIGSGNYLATAIVGKDGRFVQTTVAAASSVLSKAAVADPKGGVLLIASTKSGSGTTATYTPILQLLDAHLAPLGEARPLGPTTSADIEEVKAITSSNGQRTLITYTRAGVPYRRVVNTSLCL